MSKCNAVEANDKSKGQAQGLCSPANLVTELHAEPSSDAFVYEPLSHDSDYIRVFKIHPGPSDARICCTMREAQFSEAKYTCLSYTWQPSHPEHTIEVNGRPLSVGENLYQFLHAYRTTQMHTVPQSPYEEVDALWVDALSIDQKNIQEKGHQIRQMGKIYERAARVLIWLGVLADATKEALAEIHALAVAPVRPEEENAVREIISQTSLDFDETLALNRSESCFHRVRMRELSHHVKDLCDMTYWSRIWIAQEVLLPSDYVVFVFDGDACYEMSVYYSYFIIFVREVGNSADPLAISYFGGRCTTSLEKRAFREKPSLSSLLSLLGGCGCQNARDRIFALLPLARGAYNLDYDSDADHLFRAVFEQGIGSEPMDDVMSFGALLIEALQIRGPCSGSNKNSSGNSSKTFDSDTQIVSIRPDPSKLVAPLVWGRSTLCILKGPGNTQTSCHPQNFLCIFVGIFDAGNTHVFEYAMEEDDSEVVVRYARAYEYLQGRPQLPMPFKHYGKELRYTWLDKPSEDVYYLSGDFSRIDGSNDALHTWTSPKIEILDEVSRLTRKSQRIARRESPRIKPAIRRVTIHSPWNGGSESDSPKIFPAAAEHLANLKAYYDHHGKFPAVQLTSRCSYFC